tara:strand:- start:1291 stop:1485 length:195 start_codon:yes stop_codon:yes gene_type:complete
MKEKFYISPKRAKLKEYAQYLNERYPNAPLPGRSLMLRDKMKVHHQEIVSYDDCLQALTGSEEE